jgi:alanine dehydrogenase
VQISVPKESKNHEYRVGLTPSSVFELTCADHEVAVQTQAGTAIGYDDAAYVQAGARIVGAEEAFSGELIVKVKEPSVQECRQLDHGQILFTYLHLATAQAQAHELLNRGATAIAYETVEDNLGRLPLLAPMSEVAGRMSVQVGAQALLASGGGRGTLLGGVPGVPPGKVVVLGGGMAGSNAARMAVSLQADVTIVDQSIDRLRTLSDAFAGRAKVVMASKNTIARAVRDADLVIGAALVVGDKAPKLINRSLLAEMQTGAALVDISIDQGGCFESSHPTSHDAPTFIEQGIVHYCVTNMPGAVARTSTQALNNVTLPYLTVLATKGMQSAFADDPGFAKGLNVHQGHICHPAVSRALALHGTKGN